MPEPTSPPRGDGTHVPRRRYRAARWLVLLPVLLFAVLLVPEREPVPLALPAKRPFVWGRDQLWHDLETRFATRRAAGCAAAQAEVARMLAEGRARLAELATRPLAADAPVLAGLEDTVFTLGAEVAACPDHLAAYVTFVGELRALVKEQSRHWDLAAGEVRDRMYRLLYGGRAAVEEVLLQAPPGTVPALVRGEDEPSQTPAVTFHGVVLHSGDLLLSRGGAPTSALIARGNDYPGNFSHVALLAVDDSGHAAIVEAHIERGVAVATPAEYLRDRKLRILVLRLRADLPALRADPLLPHRAAVRAVAVARRRHIAYDFAMDYRNHDRLFCSEVAAAAYEEEGITLWAGMSSISSPGLASWLAGFGVRHLTTEEPSDLEVDPQLRVVAEWRDPDVLFKDHVDNAVIDILLEQAEAGHRLGWPVALLPVSRLAKAYSVVLNALGRVGPVPEGMSAAIALRARRLAEVHGELAGDVMSRAADFQAARGYRPPYWELVRLAREACAARRCAEKL
ncbi:MAG: YiiX/YebB-like N1pC/P60 family cysteine hydrolase [Acidobacteriota bacterium]